MWARFGGPGVHLRRLHYAIISTFRRLLRHDGKTAYLNTKQSWEHLNAAAACARFLGYVDPYELRDAHTPEPHLHARTDGDYWRPGPGWYLDAETPPGAIPSFDPDKLIEALDEWRVPDLIVVGYQYDAADQPYHLEVWIEKSTMDTVLGPVCEAYAANLVPNEGNATHSAALAALRRIADRGKPARIFYISDFDPAGEHMANAMARQIEYWASRYAPGINIKLTRLALTRRQVLEYDLPRMMIKDSDARKANFEGRHGEGAVELDALEAVTPGTLSDLVEAALARYFDADLEAELDAQEVEAQTILNAAWQLETEPQRRELDQIRSDARDVIERFRPQLEALERDLAPLRDRLVDLRQASEAAADEFDVPLPERDEGEPVDEDDDRFLLDTDRDYWTQIDYYKRDM